MNFTLTGEQEAIRKLAREFAEKQLAPTAAERDEKELFSREIFDQMAELGFMGLPYPKEYGGAGSDFFSYALVVEEISRVCASTGIGLSVHVSLACWQIYKYGNEQQKEKFLRPMLEGKKLGAFSLTEPNAGTDASAQETTAVLDGDHYILNGTKIYTTNGGEAETYVVYAMTDKSKGVKGISAFIVEKGTPGFSFGKKEVKMGIRASVQCDVIMQDCRVPVANMLGKEGDGFKIAMTTLDGGRIGVAAQALGIAQGALDHAIKFSKERIQFGKPIASNQGVSFMLADMATKVQASRLLVYHAAYNKSHHLPYSKEAAMAKLFATDSAMQVTTDAVQIFGGCGYSRLYPVERLMRDAKITQIYEGTNQAQRMVISGAVLR